MKKKTWNKQQKKTIIKNQLKFSWISHKHTHTWSWHSRFYIFILSYFCSIIIDLIRFELIFVFCFFGCHGQTENKLKIFFCWKSNDIISVIIVVIGLCRFLSRQFFPIPEFLVKKNIFQKNMNRRGKAYRGDAETQDEDQLMEFVRLYFFFSFFVQSSFQYSILFFLKFNLHHYLIE